MASQCIYSQDQYCRRERIVLPFTCSSAVATEVAAVHLAASAAAANGTAAANAAVVAGALHLRPLLAGYYPYIDISISTITISSSSIIVEFKVMPKQKVPQAPHLKLSQRTAR